MAYCILLHYPTGKLGAICDNDDEDYLATYPNEASAEETASFWEENASFRCQIVELTAS